MDDVIVQLGVGGIFAILLLREVFGFLEKKKNGPPVISEAKHHEQVMSAITTLSADITGHAEREERLLREVADIARSMSERVTYLEKFLAGLADEDVWRRRKHELLDAMRDYNKKKNGEKTS